MLKKNRRKQTESFGGAGETDQAMAIKFMIDKNYDYKTIKHVQAVILIGRTLILIALCFRKHFENVLLQALINPLKKQFLFYKINFSF